MPTLTLVQAEGLVVRALTRSRTDIGNARSVARALVAAEMERYKNDVLTLDTTLVVTLEESRVNAFVRTFVCATGNCWPRFDT